MKNVLVITSTIDYTVDYIIDKYREKVNFYRVNIDRFNEYKFILNNCNWKIENIAWSIDIDDIDSIYYRKPGLPELNEYNPKYHNMIFRDIISLINGIVDSFDGIVLTKPYILRKSENKIYQEKIAEKIGLTIPRTIFCNDKVCVNEFLKFNKTVIKPISTGKIIDRDNVEIFQTSIISENIQDEINLTPVYIQEYVDKWYELRITIIGSCLYPVKIIPYNNVDWRVDQQYNKYESVNIPKDIKSKCMKLMEEMNISFGAFDFIVTHQKEYVFLEVNPNGQWLWLEDELNINISESIVKYLVGEIV